MIISASYKTDIPAFYGQWFLNRLRAGYCMAVNAYNRRGYRVDLSEDKIDGFVFWTKNLGPFVRVLEEVHARSFPFVVQYTINGYPRALEYSVVDASRSIDHMKLLCERFGFGGAVWRYDTIIFSSATPETFHLSNFEFLARKLEGTTDEVVISFVETYQKSKRNLEIAANRFGFSWFDPPLDTKLRLVEKLVAIAKSVGMKLSLCAQPKFASAGAAEASCIDARRLERISGKTIRAEVKGNRPDCACFAAKDIGEYDTCPHGCVYCYAVKNRSLAKRRFQSHDPTGEFLFVTPRDLRIDEKSSSESLVQIGQRDLFDW